jgi:hypothetical protein
LSVGSKSGRQSLHLQPGINISRVIVGVTVGCGKGR